MDMSRRAPACWAERCTTLRAMGDEQVLSPEEQLAFARDAFASGTDFTLAIEEEFALIDPESLELVNRYEDVRGLAAGTPLDEHLAGELIASEIEVKTGRCETFADAARLLGTRREELRQLADTAGVGLGATATHPWSSWRDQRIIDTPHYRRNDEYLRYVVWRNNTFGLHVHVGVRDPDRAIRVCDAMRAFLPELLALSASSPLVEGVVTGLHSARTQIFTRMFPRCGIPDSFGSWDEFERFVRFLYDTGSIFEHTQLWWSIRPHLAFPTVEVRIADAQPDVAESRALSALAYALVARCARALDDGEPLPDLPHRYLEENLWRAIRFGLSGELIDFERGVTLPARARIEQLFDWVAPVADELGVTEFLAIPQANAAERQIARAAEGWSLEQIYAEQVGKAVAV
jgi:carboxylate-amine ligase